MKPAPNTDPARDEVFNAFMVAMGYRFINPSNIAPNNWYWTHEAFHYMRYVIKTVKRDATIEQAVTAYTALLEANTIQHQQERLRSSLLGFMGLTTSDLRDNDGNIIRDDVVSIDS